MTAIWKLSGNERVKNRRRWKGEKRTVELFQEMVKTRRTLNIALIGASECGKSSFYNSRITAFCVGRWRERATTGHFEGLAEQVTHH